MVCFDGVSKFILSDVSIHVPQGKTVGLIGASGAGKTTFLKLACGLLTPEAGEVFVMGRNPVGQRRMRDKLSVLFADKPFLDEQDTVRGNLETLRAVYRLEEGAFGADYEELSHRLGFAEFEGETVKQLSLGQRRRAELGAALLHRPKLLFLDEPAVGLDENAKREFRSLLAERKQTENMTAVLSSHDMTEISKLCDRIAFLHEGRLLFYGEMEDLRRKFQPREELRLKVTGGLPDLEDLPLERYCFDGRELRMVYRADFVKAAEILKFVLRRCSVTEVGVRRPKLEEIVSELVKLPECEIGNHARGGSGSELY